MKQRWTKEGTKKFLILHSLTCNVSCVPGLDYFTVTPMSTLSVPNTMQFCCLSHASSPLTFKSFFQYFNHVFLGWPVELLPVTIILSFFLDLVSGFMCCRWPYQRIRPRLSTFFTNHRTTLFLNSPDVTLSVSFVEHIHLIVIKSFRLRQEISAGFSEWSVKLRASN